MARSGEVTYVFEKNKSGPAGLKNLQNVEEQRPSCFVDAPLIPGFRKWLAREAGTQQIVARNGNFWSFGQNLDVTERPAAKVGLIDILTRLIDVTRQDAPCIGVHSPYRLVEATDPTE
jgi:hypothetical protein